MSAGFTTVICRNAIATVAVISHWTAGVIRGASSSVRRKDIGATRDWWRGERRDPAPLITRCSAGSSGGSDLGHPAAGGDRLVRSPQPELLHSRRRRNAQQHAQ